MYDIMDTYQLKQLLDLLLSNQNDIPICSMDHLPVYNGTFNIFITNTSFSSEPGEHWIACMAHEEIGYIFDPLGDLPQAQLRNWMTRYHLKWSFNDRRIQNFDSTTCGLFCVYFIYFAMLTLTKDYSTLCHILFPIHNVSNYEFCIKQFFYSIL